MPRARQFFVGLILSGAGLTYWVDFRLVGLGLGLFILIDSLVPGGRKWLS